MLSKNIQRKSELSSKAVLMSLTGQVLLPNLKKKILLCWTFVPALVVLVLWAKH